MDDELAVVEINPQYLKKLRRLLIAYYWIVALTEFLWTGLGPSLGYF